jgi:hypothetical protein
MRVATQPGSPFAATKQGYDEVIAGRILPVEQAFCTHLAQAGRTLGFAMAVAV